MSLQSLQSYHASYTVSSVASPRHRSSYPFFPSISPPVCPFLGANSVPSLVFFDGCLTDFLDCLLWVAETSEAYESDDLAVLEEACESRERKSRVQLVSHMIKGMETWMDGWASSQSSLGRVLANLQCIHSWT